MCMEFFKHFSTLRGRGRRFVFCVVRTIYTLFISTFVQSELMYYWNNLQFYRSPAACNVMQETFYFYLENTYGWKSFIRGQVKWSTGIGRMNWFSDSFRLRWLYKILSPKDSLVWNSSNCVNILCVIKCYEGVWDACNFHITCNSLYHNLRVCLLMKADDTYAF